VELSRVSLYSEELSVAMVVRSSHWLCSHGSAGKFYGPIFHSEVSWVSPTVGGRSLVTLVNRKSKTDFIIGTLLPPFLRPLYAVSSTFGHERPWSLD
jgi:hypothetical protein